MKILLTGASGQLGREIVKICPADYKLQAMTRDQLDVCAYSDCENAVRVCKPDFIINAAAWTDVDGAEEAPEKAMLVNGDAPFHLANAARKYGARLVHISTDYVFDGKLRRPYRPDDAAEPVNVYGRSKLAGEQSVLSVLGEKALVIRTSWLYSADGRNFVKTILRLLRDREELQVVNDQFGSPTSVSSLAYIIFAAMKAEIGGIYHWSDKGSISWWNFAKAVQHSALELGLTDKFREIKPIPTSQFKTLATRPAWSVLDCSSLADKLRIKPPPYEEALFHLLTENRPAFRSYLYGSD